MKNKIEIVLVNSSAIHSAEYDVSRKEMTVCFNNKSVYTYLGVPRFYWRGLFEASSKGRFLNNYIFKKFEFVTGFKQNTLTNG